MNWKKYKGVVIVVVFMGIMVSVYIFAIERLVAEIESRRNKLQELETIQEGQRKRLVNIPEFKKDYEALTEAEKKIYPLLKNDTAVELIQEVEKLAEDTGNTVSIEVESPKVPNKSVAKNTKETIIGSLPMKDYIQLKIQVTGSFFSLIKLLTKLENARYYLDIVSLQVSRNQNPVKVEVSKVVTKNPFSGSSAAEKDDSEKPEEDSQETISLINVVVYTSQK